MLKVKKSLAAAVLCAVASVGFVVNVYAQKRIVSKMMKNLSLLSIQ